MKILITGAGGFIGSHLCEMLALMNHEVSAMVHYNSNGHRGWLEESACADVLKFTAGDVANYDYVQKIIFGTAFDAVVHLAALIGIPYSYVSPGAYIKTNVQGTGNILEACRISKRRLIVVSTSEVFGIARAESMDESHPRAANSPYAASKIAAEELARSFRASYGMEISIVRPFNVFGPRQSMRAVIPTIIRQIMAGQREIKLGNLKPRRDFTFVDDTCAAIWKIIEAPEPPRVVNIGTGRTRPIGDIAQLIVDKIGAGNCKIVEEGNRKRTSESEVHCLCCDPEVIKGYGWKPAYSFEEGLETTIEWMRRNRAKRAGEYHV